MARELGITIYLFVFRILFNMFKLFPQKKKTIGVASFGDNLFYTVNSLNNLADEEIIILKDPSCRYEFDSSVGSIIPFDIKQPVSFLKSIYHLATATTILVDTYFGFLAAATFRKGTTCIQLWHAGGAIKHFGLMDPSNEFRSVKAIERFQQVYNRFDYTVVGSEKMADTFRESFGLPDEKMLRTGIPRSDVLFDESVRKQSWQDLVERFPAIKGKKIILYAPTFREQQLTNYALELDIKQLYKALSDEYVLFIKLHPAVSSNISFSYGDFVFDVSDYKDTNALLLITDLLITDYSSIPFEYALLEKPMIFFAYDLEEYRVTSGLIEDYENQMPGPVVASTEAIILAISEDRFDINRIRAFADDWNKYSNGNSSLNLSRFLTGTEEKEKEEVLV
ncbi:CDP-glycerol--glycerophosphate glycerophosphotransferase [Virgibacillus indicus]|uniref:CDP-glycerol--glycerophosphate glycerophosphotransferase n=1 Tax=Virgibacillus indicus TaxID=2024554 RepID=A0A265NA67_9BACI|nr:CDP-glycerol glycerophosphotransferase family protein [Virgibacillus indicus]OZU88374.1 CDP-glycerol--glycerophosphate glycerophosphotransferase [Virgibacillus indicus]